MKCSLVLWKMNLKYINKNESLLECPFSTRKSFSHLFNFIKQGALVIALISVYYIRATFKLDQEGKREGEIVS